MSLTIPAVASRIRSLRARFPVGESKRRVDSFEAALARLVDVGAAAHFEDFHAADPALDGLTFERVLRLGATEDEAREVDALRGAWRTLWSNAKPRCGHRAKVVRAAVTAEDEA